MKRESRTMINKMIKKNLCTLMIHGIIKTTMVEDEDKEAGLVIEEEDGDVTTAEEIGDRAEKVIGDRAETRLE